MRPCGRTDTVRDNRFMWGNPMARRHAAIQRSQHVRPSSSSCSSTRRARQPPPSASRSSNSKAGARWSRLSALCRRPGGSHPLVLLLHGSGGLEQATGEVFQGIARKMAARGYVVLIPHLFDRKGGPREWLEVVDDAIAFAARGGVEYAGVDRERIGLFGFSMGSRSPSTAPRATRTSGPSSLSRASCRWIQREGPARPDPVRCGKIKESRRPGSTRSRRR